MREKKRIGAVAVLLTALVLSGCSENHKNSENNFSVSNGNEQIEAVKKAVVSEPTELTFVFAEGDKGGKAAMIDMVNRFNEQYENITVNIHSSGSGSYDEILKTLESVGEFPDLLETTNVAAYVRAGVLAELPENIVSLFETVTEFDGKYYTAPQARNNTYGIIYNKEYFDTHDLAEPSTYEEFIELCEKIKELGDMSPLGVGAQDLWHIGFWFEKAYEDQVLSRDPDFITHCYEGTKSFTDEIFQAVIEELKEIIGYAQDGWASTPDAQVTTLLLNERTAMVYTGGHVFLDIEEADPDFEVGWFSIPGPDGKLRLVGGAAANGLAISAETIKNPNKKAAAEEFIRFFFEKENYQYYCKALDIIPTTVDAPQIEYSQLVKEVLADLDAADSVGPTWNNETGNKELPGDFRNYTYETLVEVLQGDRDTESACEEIQKAWERSIRSFNPVTGVF